MRATRADAAGARLLWVKTCVGKKSDAYCMSWMNCAYVRVTIIVETDRVHCTNRQLVKTLTVSSNKLTDYLLLSTIPRGLSTAFIHCPVQTSARLCSNTRMLGPPFMAIVPTQLPGSGGGKGHGLLEINRANSERACQSAHGTNRRTRCMGTRYMGETRAL
jgi:hypothetical protein